MHSVHLLVTLMCPCMSYLSMPSQVEKLHSLYRQFNELRDKIIRDAAADRYPSHEDLAALLSIADEICELAEKCSIPVPHDVKLFINRVAKYLDEGYELPEAILGALGFMLPCCTAASCDP